MYRKLWVDTQEAPSKHDNLDTQSNSQKVKLFPFPFQSLRKRSSLESTPKKTEM